MSILFNWSDPWVELDAELTGDTEYRFVPVGIWAINARPLYVDVTISVTDTSELTFEVTDTGLGFISTVVPDALLSGTHLIRMPLTFASNDLSSLVIRTNGSPGTIIVHRIDIVYQTAAVVDYSADDYAELYYTGLPEEQQTYLCTPWGSIKISIFDQGLTTFDSGDTRILGSLPTISPLKASDLNSKDRYVVFSKRNILY